MSLFKQNNADDKTKKTIVKVKSSQTLSKDIIFTETGSEYFVVSSECRFNYTRLEEDKNTSEYLSKKEQLDISLPLQFQISKNSNTTYEMPDYFSLINPVISNNIYEILSAIELKKIDFIPCILKENENKEYKNYYAMHIYNYISCLDETYSDIDRYESKIIKSISKLKLSVSALSKIPMKDRLIFRVAEAPYLKIFHKSIVELILKKNITGIKFYKAREWHDGIDFESKLNAFKTK